MKLWPILVVAFLIGEVENGPRHKDCIYEIYDGTRYTRTMLRHRICYPHITVEQ